MSTGQGPRIKSVLVLDLYIEAFREGGGTDSG